MEMTVETGEGLQIEGFTPAIYWTQNPGIQSEKE